MEPTPAQIGKRIAQAIDTASDQLLAGKPAVKRRRVALAIGISDDTLDRYIKGKGDTSAILVWQIGQMTGHPFAWFAGQDSTAEERLAVVAEHANAQVAAVGEILEALRVALAEAAAFRVDDVELDRSAGVGEQRREKPGKSVAVPRETAG